MATFGGPNLELDNIILYLDSTNSKSYINNQTNWLDLSSFRNQMTLNDTTFDTLDSSLVLSNVNSKLNATIPINALPNITISFIVKLKGALNEIQSFTKNSVLISGLNQNVSKFNIITKTFTNNSNNITEKTYLNGEKLNETTYLDSNFLNFNTLKIEINTTNKSGTAKIQNLLIYNIALSDTQIQQNYNAVKTRFGL